MDKNEIPAYGCEDKIYMVKFYPDITEKQDRFGCTSKVIGRVENFNPSTHVVIKDNNRDLWVIEYKMVVIMRPANQYEIKSFENNNA